MKDILIKVNSKTSKVDLPTDMLGITGENLQGKLKFEMSKFIDGQGLLLVRQEYDNMCKDSFIYMDKTENGYEIEIKNSLLKGWEVHLQLQIVEPERDTKIPVFKSNMFYLKVGETIPATEEIPEEYPTWLEKANAKLAEMDEAIAYNNEVVAETIRMRDAGEFKGEKGDKGDKGDPGKDAVLPEGIVIDKNYVHTDNNFTTAEKNKLADLFNYDDTLIQQEINSVSEIANQNTLDISNLDNRVETLNEELQEQEETLKHLDENKADKETTYTKEEVNNLISQIKSVEFVIVEELPEVGETNKIYLKLNETQKEKNIYDEYIYVENKWELIGSTAIDLSDYYNKEEINTKLNDYCTNEKADGLFEETLVQVDYNIYLQNKSFYDEKYNIVLADEKEDYGAIINEIIPGESSTEYDISDDEIEIIVDEIIGG